MIPIRKYKIKLHISDFEGLKIPAIKVLEYALGLDYDQAKAFIERHEGTVQDCILTSNQLGALVAAQEIFLRHGLRVTNVEEFEYPRYNDFTQIP